MIDIVIVNWNAGTQLLDAVTSVVQYHYGLVSSIVIVDNASTDDSLAQVEALVNRPFQIQIVRNQANRGFGAACNQGAALATSEYLLFLNPDMRLFEDSLSKPIHFMQQPSNSGIGICGIKLVDEEGRASTSAARFPTLNVMAGQTLGLSKWIPGLFPAHLLTSDILKESGVVDQVIGAFFLIRKSVFVRCEGFDERFFVYFEEVDLALRVKKLGYSSYFFSDAAAFHKGGGCSDQIKATRLFYSLRSRILYAKKNYASIEYVGLILLTAIELPMRLAQGVIRTSWKDIHNTFIAYGQLLAFFIKGI